MTVGILIVLGIGLLLTYIIWQETRSHLHWRGLVREGNVWAIQELTSAEIERWHRMRPPKGMPVVLWAGIQSVELVTIGKGHIQVACGTEGEYRTVAGRREQTMTPLAAAMRLAAKLADMLLYDIPEVKIDCVRVDVYSSVGTDHGVSEQACILTTTAERRIANQLAWEDLTSQQIIDSFQSCYRLEASGAAIRIDPGPPLPAEPIEPAIPDEVRRSRAYRRRHEDV